MARHDTDLYELNEVSWWGKWVDETTWISKNCYVIFSEAFRDESFFNRSGFLGTEKLPAKVVEVIEKVFVKKGRHVSSVLLEEGHEQDKLRASLRFAGYAASDKMIVMESEGLGKGSNPEVKVSALMARSPTKELQDWTRAYLAAFYGEQKLGVAVNKIVRGVAKDKSASLLLAKIGGEVAGCSAMYRTKGNIVGAYCIGTVPNFRKRGVGATMVRQMQQIAEKERRQLILQTLASDSVEGFYLKLGFKQAYVKDVFERRLREKGVEGRGLGESFGVRINRSAKAGTTRPFAEVFEGFERVEAVRRMFGSKTEEVIEKLKISLDSPRGYLRVDGVTGNVIINPEYLRAGQERHLYLDVLHELAHVKQFMEGKELYDRRYQYFERPTEIEAYVVAVEEARRLGMKREEIVEYLRVEWVTDEEFAKFVGKMRIRDED